MCVENWGGFEEIGYNVLGLGKVEDFEAECFMLNEYINKNSDSTKTLILSKGS